MRYTISRHQQDNDVHYDLFLEESDSLKTFRLNAPPESGEASADEISPHRKIYLDYEGAISDNRGDVTIHSAGIYRMNDDQLILEGGPSAGRYQFVGGLLQSLR